MNKLLTPVFISLLLLTATPSQATSFNRDRLENIPDLVRDSLVSKGIKAYKAGNYQAAIDRFNHFLNPRRVIATPVELEGLIYLALAYQKVGEHHRATETIVRATSIANLSPIDLANIKNIAGIIAYQQNKKIVANKHWEQARQLYLASEVTQGWVETTLNLAKNYRELGYFQKSQKLLEELTKATVKPDLPD